LFPAAVATGVIKGNKWLPKPLPVIRCEAKFAIDNGLGDLNALIPESTVFKLDIGHYPVGGAPAAGGA